MAQVFESNFTTNEAPHFSGWNRVSFLSILTAIKNSILKSVASTIAALMLAIILFAWTTVLINLVFLRLGLSPVGAAACTTLVIILLMMIPVGILYKQTHAMTNFVQEMKSTPLPEIHILPKIPVERIKQIMPKVALCAFGAGVLLGLKNRDNHLRRT